MTIYLRTVGGGLPVPAGSVVVAVNGMGLLGLPDPAAALRNTAGTQVRLSVQYNEAVAGESPALGPSTEIVVAPLTKRQWDDLRYSDWEAGRRSIVEARTDGMVGYLHLRSTSTGSYEDFARQFFPVQFLRGHVVLHIMCNRHYALLWVHCRHRQSTNFSTPVQ